MVFEQKRFSYFFFAQSEQRGGGRKKNKKTFFVQRPFFEKFFSKKKPFNVPYWTKNLPHFWPNKKLLFKSLETNKFTNSNRLIFFSPTNCCFCPNLFGDGCPHILFFKFQNNFMNLMQNLPSEPAQDDNVD